MVFISQPTFNEFLALVTRLNSARGQRNKEEVRNEMGRHYTENIYNRYVADIARRKGAVTKAMAKKIKNWRIIFNRMNQFCEYFFF